ncbi:hypothetical protein ACIHQR_30280 [Corallococcus coralloides]|uniref:hypothetical protein n=1 Tax=Corallococcus coralloides TaxID=184914 RepID=UPI00384D6E5B
MANDDKLSVVDCVQHLLTDDMFLAHVPLEHREEAREELASLFNQLGTEALNAERRKVSLFQAGLDDSGYPYLFRLHSIVRDILTHELPPDAMEAARRGMQFAQETIQRDGGQTFELLLKQLGRIAISPAARPIDRALSRLALYHLLRMVLAIMEHQQKGDLAFVGVRDDDLDKLAEGSLQWWMEEAAADGDDGLRVINFSIAACMSRLTEHVDIFKVELARLDADHVRLLHQRKEIVAHAQSMTRRDDLLLSNLFAPLFGKQRVSISLLRKRHPMVLGDYSDDALYKQTERIKTKLSEGTPPQRTATSSLLDAAAAMEGTVRPLPSDEEEI